jgi:hypothetical protein
VQWPTGCSCQEFYVPANIPQFEDDSLLAGILRRVVSLRKTDVSDMRTASIIKISPISKAVRISETLVYIETTRHCIPERWHLHTRRRENLNSHVSQFITFLSCLLRFQQRPVNAWVLSSFTISWVIIVSGYRLDYRSSIPGRGKGFFL